MDVRQFEENRWNREDQKPVFRHEAARSLIASLGSQISVLDLGCGDGLLLSLLESDGVHGTGLDLSETAVKKAQARGLDARAHDFAKPLPYADRTFDIVVMLDVLEHLYDPATLLAEATRVSKKYVLVGVPNFSSLPARLQVLLGRVPENNLPKKGHVYWFNFPILRSLLEKVGLHIVGQKVNTPWQNVPVVGALWKFFARFMPNTATLSFVVLASK